MNPNMVVIVFFLVERYKNQLTATNKNMTVFQYSELE